MDIRILEVYFPVAGVPITCCLLYLQRLYEVHEKDKETLAIGFGITCCALCLLILKSMKKENGISQGSILPSSLKFLPSYHVQLLLTLFDNLIEQTII
ncbi:hypothetical protein PCC7424_2131 [Gloeothece citriformis PCC 7424]|uniref:Uncharacterized protein n=1 Tax=Gloeothece citriformis (strain PCC 7424) TaxID=65393 RepID=B7KG87_GLOC7|nr:hypothetical protein PCC7424_2131 [Gloeothece citriformis PCC 7424]